MNCKAHTVTPDIPVDLGLQIFPDISRKIYYVILYYIILYYIILYYIILYYIILYYIILYYIILYYAFAMYLHRFQLPQPTLIKIYTDEKLKCSNYCTF